MPDPLDDFSAWYEREHPRVTRALWVIARDVELAADAAAQAFGAAYERWEQVSRMESPGGWVQRVAINAVRRRLRRQALEARLMRRELPRPVEPEETDIDLWRAVAALPTRQREAVALRYVADLREAEVAAAMGVSVGAASASLAAARSRLAELLTEAEEPTRT